MQRHNSTTSRGDTQSESGAWESSTKANTESVNPEVVACRNRSILHRSATMFVLTVFNVAKGSGEMGDHWANRGPQAIPVLDVVKSDISHRQKGRRQWESHR
jgi:hypothetical protein